MLDSSIPSYDVHHHLWPEPLQEALARRTRPPRLRGSVLELTRQGSFEVDLDAHRLERRVSELDRDEVDVAVVSLAPTTLELESLPEDEAEPLLAAYHEGIAELAGGSGGRLLAFAAGRALDGFVGASVPAGDLVDLDRVSRLLDELTLRRGVLFVHPGAADARDGAPAWWLAVVDYTAQMQAAYAAWIAGGLNRWPELRVVFALLAGGAPFQLDRLRSRGVDVRDVLRPNVYFETASYGRQALELCLATFGVGQLLYGSDAPVIDPRPTLRSVRGFGQAVSDALLRDNPERLFG